MFELRPYQWDVLRGLQQSLRVHRKTIVRMPTGSGKTVLVGELARRFATKHTDRRGTMGLFLVHRRRLVNQTVDKLRGFGFEEKDIGVIGASYPPKPWAIMQVAMIQTLARRSDPIDPVFVVVDECHHARASQYEKVIARFPNAYLIGLSATPARLDGKGLGHIFSDIVEGASERELIDSGSLAPYKMAYIPSGVDMKGVRKSMGDYSKSQMAERVTKKVIASVANNYAKIAHRRPAIFFGVSIYHSEEVAAALRERGYRAKHIDHKTDAFSQECAMRDFENGSLDVLCNVELFTEGVDAPRCEVVMLGRLTSSVVLYRQMCGRAFRPAEGKEALIMDLSGCFYEHGYPDEPILWSLEGGAETEVNGYQKPQSKVRVCRNASCAEIYAKILPQCPSCGLLPPVFTAAEIDVDLKIATGDEQIGPKPKRGGAKLFPADYKRIRESGASLEVLQEIGRSRGYQPGWARKMSDYYKKFLTKST